jgi:hypothetical protein
MISIVSTVSAWQRDVHYDATNCKRGRCGGLRGTLQGFHSIDKRDESFAIPDIIKIAPIRPKEDWNSRHSNVTAMQHKSYFYSTVTRNAILMAMTQITSAAHAMNKIKILAHANE